MKAKVTTEFRDATDNRIYLPGNDYEGDEARVAELEAGGFVKRAEQKTQERKPAPRKRAARAEGKE